MRLIYVFVLMTFPFIAFSQEEAFYIELNDETLADAFEKIESTRSVLFSYNDDFISGKRISLSGKDRTLTEVLDEISKRLELNYSIIKNRYVIINANTVATTTSIQTLEKITLKSYLTKGIVKNNDGSFKLYPSKLGILPGLTEPDVLESIQLLPGVLSPNETATGFFIRGGTSDQNRVIWDGINLYHKGHLFGMISPINPNVASSISFINKGTHAKYGERLSSVIDVVSSSSIENELKAQVGVNGINADAVLFLPLIKDKLSLQSSVRRSYVDIFETPTFNQFSDKVFESTKINSFKNGTNEFSFLDYNFKINYKPDSKNTLFASIISIDNQLDHDVSERDEDKIFTDQLVTNNIGYGAGWDFIWNDNLVQNTRFYFSNYSLDYNFITQEFGEVISEFEKRNTIIDSGVSTELTFLTEDNNSYNVGYQYALKDVAYAFLSSSDLNFILDSEKRIVQNHSIYGQYNYSNSNLFSIDIGLRGSYFKELDAVRFEPRLLLQKLISPHLSLQISGEIKNQVISEIDETLLSNLSLENRVWRLSDGDDFPIMNGQQVSAGFLYSFNGFNVDIDSYYKKLKNITALSLGFLNPENSNFNIGEQNVFGVDVFFKKQLNRFNSWFSYSYNNSRSMFNGLNNNQEFRSKSNISHAVSTALSYKIRGLQLSLGWKWQTGKPFTITQEVDDVLTFTDGVNTGELPIYHRLDFSSTYDFKFSDVSDFGGKVGLSIRNVYNRATPISREYRGNNTLNDPIELIERYSTGITPNLMFRLYW
jgi:hypothetical protein